MLHLSEPKHALVSRVL